MTVKGLTSEVNEISGNHAKMSVTGRRFHAVGFSGHTMRIYTTNGVLSAEFEVVNDDFSIDLPLQTGMYVIADVNSNRTLKFFIK